MSKVSWFKMLLVLIAASEVAAAAAHCERLPDGSWSCPAPPNARPTAMDVRIECPTARGSGTAVARLENGGTAIVTNHHVVRNQSQITVHSGNGQIAAAKLAAVDEANDLAIVTISDRWPIVTLGNDVTVGTAVHFRAFDGGERFRKYYGHVVSRYSKSGTVDGYFATGTAAAGNSGGGVYHRGKLVGVVWGAPRGQTAFVRIGPVRRLIAQLRAKHMVTYPPSRPAAPASPRLVPSGTPQPCDCRDRWAELEGRLDSLHANNRSDLFGQLDWPRIAAAALGLSGPVGLGIAIAGAFVGRRFKQRNRGPGGPRAGGFPNSASRVVPDHGESK